MTLVRFGVLLGLVLAGCGKQSAGAESCEPPDACGAEACAPGVVALCIGPGECQGTQACRADGSGYERCDCSSGASLLGDDQSCVAAGEFNCSLTERCCSGSTCIEYEKRTVCAALCDSGEDCESGCCAPREPTVSVCSPPDACMPAQSCLRGSDCETGCCVGLQCAPAGSCASQVPAIPSGWSLFAEDGTLLGRLSSDATAFEGVCNVSSPFGNTSSPTSIFNPSGSYGSTTSPLSAYHPTTFTPPFFYDASNDEYWAVVSKNPALSLVIDPDELCATLPSLGL